MSKATLLATLNSLLREAERGRLEHFSFAAQIRDEPAEGEGDFIQITAIANERNDEESAWIHVGTFLCGSRAPKAHFVSAVSSLAHEFELHRNVRLVPIWIIEEEGGDRLYTSTRAPSIVPKRDGNVAVYRITAVLPAFREDDAVPGGVLPGVEAAG